MRRIIILLALAVAASAAENPDLLVTTSWLQQHLRDRQLTIIDIGDRASYEAAHIPGARFLALNDVVVGRNGIPNEVPDPAALEQTLRRAGIPNRGRIILYARDPIAAARVFFTLDYAGHGDDVALLDGGFKKWTSERRNTQTGPPHEVNVAAFVVRPHPETIVRLTAMRLIAGCAASMPGNVAIVDARSPDEYIGAVPGASIRHPGHIDYAINVPWNENFTGGETPVFLPIADLRELYRGAGIHDDASVITYCRTGMQACVDYFVLRYLGRDVHLYDGSYIEWSEAPLSLAVTAGPSSYKYARNVLPAEAGGAKRGREAFIGLHCHACHQVAGDNRLPQSTHPGPLLHDLGGLTPQSVANKIVSRSSSDAEAVYDTPMAPFADALTPQQLDDIVAYLRRPQQQK